MKNNTNRQNDINISVYDSIATAILTVQNTRPRGSPTWSVVENVQILLHYVYVKFSVGFFSSIFVKNSSAMKNA